MDVDCDLITGSGFFYTDKLNGFVRQVVTNPDKCAWILKGSANVQGNNIVLPADATVEITSKKAGNEGFVLTISTDPTPPAPAEPPAPPTPVALADALNNIRYQYPDYPPAVNGVNVGQPGQNFRDTFFDCDAISETATYYVPPPTGVTSMRVDLINFLNCSVTTTPNVNPSLSGNFQRRILSINGQAAITNTSTGKTLTVIYGNPPAATFALSSRSARGVVGAAIAPISLQPISITPTGYSVDPALPNGVSIDPTSGEISGTPTAPSQGQYAITASDGTETATGILTLEISASQPHEVMFDQGLGTNPIGRSVTPGQFIMLPPTNSLASNSVFGGWYTEPNGAGDFAGMDGEAYTPTSSLTLHAKWSPAAKITFTRMTTSDPYPTFPIELQPFLNAAGQLVMSIAQGTTITLPVPTRVNAGFRGWYSSSSCPTSGSQPSTFIGVGGAEVAVPALSTVTWKACWQTSNLNIDFAPSSGTFTGSDDICTGSSSCRRTWTAVGGPLTSSGRPQVITPTPNRPRYVFNGWFTASSGGIRVAGANEPLGVDLLEPTSSRTFRAQWTPMIVFDPGEGQEVNDQRCQREQDTPRLCLIPWVDNPLLLPTPTSAAGLIPTGWFQGSTRQGAPGEMWNQSPYGGATLTAKWEAPVVPATVSFDVQADDVAGVPPESTSVGARITLPRPTREGYAFRGWFTAASGGVPAVGAGGKYVVTGDVTLYARWLTKAAPPRPVAPDPSNPPSAPTPEQGTIVDEDGRETPIVLRPIPRRDDTAINIGVSVGRDADDTNGVPGFQIDLEGVNAEGDPVELSPEGLLILSEDRRVAAEGTGFAPEAPVAFYLLPSDQPIVAASVKSSWLRARTIAIAATEPLLLDTLTVDDTGNFTGTLVLPDGLSSGDYLVQAVGPVSNGELLTVTLGVRVEVAPEPEPATLAGPPLNLSATPSDGAVVLTWSPPERTGDFPITQYQVVGSPSATCLVQVPVRTCIITGLTNGVEYTFRVRALTGAGWGSYSESTSAVIPEVGDSASIIVTGTRADVRGRPGVQVRGVTTGLEGALVTPRVRLAKEEAYSDGVGLRTVGQDGRFSWQRVANRWVYVYFVADGARSNRLVFR